MPDDALTVPYLLAQERYHATLAEAMNLPTGVNIWIECGLSRKLFIVHYPRWPYYSVRVKLFCYSQVYC